MSTSTATTSGPSEPDRSPAPLATSTTGTTLFCIAEDRTPFETGIRAAVASVQLHMPGQPMVVFAPAATPALASWLARHPTVELRRDRLPGLGWGVKPHALMTLLDEGYEDVVWLDSDCLLTRPLATQLAADAGALWITEEARWGAPDVEGLRATGWGLEVGRRFAWPLNTAVLRVGRAHLDLLRRWCVLLADLEYVEAQQSHPSLRAIHTMGDQDVLEALLASTEFAGVDIRVLSRGAEIVQYTGPLGFTTSERIQAARRGGPLFIQAQGPKP